MLVVYKALMWAGSFWCHQMPERSPYIFGMQFPLCWRCTGIAVGALFLIAYIFLRRRLPGLSLSLLLALPMPIDALLAVAGLWQGHNGVRFVTGSLWGFFGVAAALGLFASLITRTGSKNPQSLLFTR